jgi:CxxC-x17-CxxC domain-containing protein
MHQGNWTCSRCGGAITELPFIPRSEAGLTCRSCYAAQKGRGSSSAAAPAEFTPAAEAMPDIPYDEDDLATEPPPPDLEAAFGATSAPAERPTFSGNWQCANCGEAITSLPFAPRSTNNLQCRDCFKRSRS